MSIQACFPGRKAAAASPVCPCAMQGNVHALQTDKWLAVRGSDSIFALGDAATIVQDRALEHAAELFVQVFCTSNTNNITVIQCCLHTRSSTAQAGPPGQCLAAAQWCAALEQSKLSPCDTQPACTPLRLRCLNSAS